SISRSRNIEPDEGSKFKFSFRMMESPSRLKSSTKFLSHFLRPNNPAPGWVSPASKKSLRNTGEPLPSAVPQVKAPPSPSVSPASAAGRHFGIAAVAVAIHGDRTDM